jgi:hypothetical protein
MSSISTTMTAAVERGMRSASVEFALEVIGQLDSEGVLKCSLDEALKMFDFESVKVVSSRSKASKKRETGKTVKKASKSKITAKPAVVLPFCGEIQGDWCKGVKFSHGLHTQCTMGPSGEDIYCKTCRKHADNSATGKPPYGDINDRAEFDVDYRDPKGKLTLPYANVVEKLGISMEAAVAAAATLGWTIPAEQLVKRASKRGRPAKSAAVSDSDSDTEETKKRGRPSKAKVAAPTQEDQIAQLVAEAYTETTKPVVKVKKLKVKKVTLTTEQKEQPKLAKKEAALKLKAEKKEAADKLKAEKKEAADKLKAEKKEAADNLKAEKAAALVARKAISLKLKEDKATALLAKKEAALKFKEEKLVAKALEKEAKEAAALKVKSEKKALALKVRQEKAADKKAEREAAKFRKKEAADKLKAEKADEAEVDVVFPELEEEKIADINSSDEEEKIADIDSSDDEDGECELSETMTVSGVEYYFSEQDGQTVLFSKTGEPVGVYDADTDTVQECEFDEE